MTKSPPRVGLRLLPDAVRAQMSSRARGIFRAAVRLSRSQHRDDEDMAFRLAWSAEQREFEREARNRRR